MLPPDLERENAQGDSAAELKAKLIGTIVSGTAYSRAEVYRSGVITLPLQVVDVVKRLQAMNGALGAYSEVVRARSANKESFVPFEPMPGNSFNSKDQSVCWTPAPRQSSAGR